MGKEKLSAADLFEKSDRYRLHLLAMICAAWEGNGNQAVKPMDLAHALGMPHSEAFDAVQYFIRYRLVVDIAESPLSPRVLPSVYAVQSIRGITDRDRAERKRASPGAKRRAATGPAKRRAVKPKTARSGA